MTTDAIAGDPLLEQGFFDRADTLWEQFSHTLSTGEKSNGGTLRQVASPDNYTFLLATADQVFTHDLVLGFLHRLRAWGKQKLGARHASTPQIHVYVNGCLRRLAPDATQARWHYLYSLSHSETFGIRLVIGDGGKRLGIALRHIARFHLPFNQLLVHQAQMAYALDGPKRTKNPLESTILLHGYLW